MAGNITKSHPLSRVFARAFARFARGDARSCTLYLYSSSKYAVSEELREAIGKSLQTNSTSRARPFGGKLKSSSRNSKGASLVDSVE